MKGTMDVGIPEFKSLEEEREYWEARGPLAEGHKGQLNKPKRGQKRSSFLAVRLTGEELTRLRDLAAKQGLGPSTFARLILTAAIGQEVKLPKKKTWSEVMEAIERNSSPEANERLLTLFESLTIGEPPYLLELTEKEKLEEFGRLSLALILDAVGMQLAEEKQPMKASTTT